MNREGLPPVRGVALRIDRDTYEAWCHYCGWCVRYSFETFAADALADHVRDECRARPEVAS